jgi:transposase InsO family protein
MTEERIELSQRERDKLKILHELERHQIRQYEAAKRLGLSTRQIRRLQARLKNEGDRAVVHRLRGVPSNRKISPEKEREALELLKSRYADFGPTLASEHLGREGYKVSRETVRKWMVREALWKPKPLRVKAIHVWRERRSSFGELVMMDSSEYRWLENRGPELQLIAMIDDATSRIWGRFTEHDTTEENMRTLEGWLRRHGRPLALYTDRGSVFHVNRKPNVSEQLQGQQKPLTQFGRAMRELDIRFLAARSPQAKGRIERLFGTLQDRLVKEMRLQKIDTIEKANRFLENVFIPAWEKRFTVMARNPVDAHQPLGKEHRLESIFSIRKPRDVSADYTVSWDGKKWAIARSDVTAGLRGARIEVELRLDGSLWGRYRNSFLALKQCARPTPVLVETSSGLRPSEVSTKIKPKKKCIPPPDHPWRKPFPFSRKQDISILQKSGHF